MIYDRPNHKFINPKHVVSAYFRSFYQGSYQLVVDLKLVNGETRNGLLLAETNNVRDVNTLFIDTATKTLQTIYDNIDSESVADAISHGLQSISTYQREMKQ